VEALLGVAEAERATQVVIGRGPSRRLNRPGHASLADRMIRRARDIDVHVVPIGAAVSSEPGPLPGRVPVARQIVGAVVGAALLVALTAVLVHSRGEMTVATSLALYLLAVVAITAVGGPWPGLIAAVVAPLLANWYLIPPYHTFRIAAGENLLELLVFLSVAAIVSWFVSIAARRAAEAQRARTEAATLAELSSSASGDLPDVLVEQLRRTFRLEGVAVLASVAADAAGDEATPVLARAGDAPVSAATADLVAPLASGYVVAARGGPLTADEQRVLQPFLGQLSRALEQQRLRQIAAESDALARADELRTALLRAVSHDLRSPLASIKASVSSLRQPDVQWPPEMRDDFLESIELETDRLTAIITNLLDMSRLEAGVLRPVLRTTSLEEVVPSAVHGTGQRAKDVVIEMPPDLAEVQADPALLERVVATLVTNAVHWSPVGATVRLHAHRSAATVQLHIIDHGPGIPRHQQAAVLQPFHRLDDSGSGGLGLGLAIADRLVAAMGGQLELRDTPGGGLTVVVALPVSPGEHP
jgi:two-component system sensor histidine kinase KdpD